MTVVDLFTAPPFDWHALSWSEIAIVAGQCVVGVALLFAVGLTVERRRR